MEKCMIAKSCARKVTGEKLDVAHFWAYAGESFLFSSEK